MSLRREPTGAFEHTPEIDIPKGHKTLNGEDVLSLARSRSLSVPSAYGDRNARDVRIAELVISKMKEKFGIDFYIVDKSAKDIVCMDGEIPHEDMLRHVESWSECLDVELTSMIQTMEEDMSDAAKDDRVRRATEAIVMRAVNRVWVCVHGDDIPPSIVQREGDLDGQRKTITMRNGGIFAERLAKLVCEWFDGNDEWRVWVPEDRPDCVSIEPMPDHAR